MAEKCKIHITGRCCLALALWLLLVPLRWVAAAVVSAFVHELGHIAALWMCGIRIWRIEIDAFGAKMETAPMSSGAELLCALAGPLAGGLLCLFWMHIPGIALWAAAQSLYNLLPIYPLDGGRALRAVRKICCKDEHLGL